ncbi:MAG: XRE family transcriptional regulator [Silicimonas sp.]|nr:XRE family transcriptional regulator [Silicimonas sp.]
MSKTEIEAAVGRAVKRLRKSRGQTVTGLASSAGVSQGMVSRIETGQVSPSLATLGALAAALDVPVMALLAGTGETGDVHHVKAGEGLPSRRVATDHVHDYLLLGKHTGPGGTFQSARIRIDRDQAGRLPRYQHEGHVFLYVISGAARYRCGSEMFDLAQGDTLSFDAKLAHGFTEITGDHVEFLTVSARPE